MTAADEAFLDAFEACTFPPAEWHHREHIKAAFLYLSRQPLAEACDRMRAAIRAYNAAHGTTEAPHSGYHETMTVAWMQLVHLAMQASPPSADADAFVDAHPGLLDKKALLRFYSRDRIMSAAAKREFLAPDVQPFRALPAPGSP